MSGLTLPERRLLADRVLGGAEPSPLLLRAVEDIVTDREARAREDERERIALAITAHADATLPKWLHSNYETAARVARTTTGATR